MSFYSIKNNKFYKKINKKCIRCTEKDIRNGMQNGGELIYSNKKNELLLIPNKKMFFGGNGINVKNKEFEKVDDITKLPSIVKNKENIEKESLINSICKDIPENVEYLTHQLEGKIDIINLILKSENLRPPRKFEYFSDDPYQYDLIYRYLENIYLGVVMKQNIQKEIHWFGKNNMIMLIFSKTLMARNDYVYNIRDQFGMINEFSYTKKTLNEHKNVLKVNYNPGLVMGKLNLPITKKQVGLNEVAFFNDISLDYLHEIWLPDYTKLIYEYENYLSEKIQLYDFNKDAQRFIKMNDLIQLFLDITKLREYGEIYNKEKRNLIIKEHKINEKTLNEFINYTFSYNDENDYYSDAELMVRLAYFKASLNKMKENSIKIDKFYNELCSLLAKSKYNHIKVRKNMISYIPLSEINHKKDFKLCQTINTNLFKPICQSSLTVNELNSNEMIYTYNSLSTKKKMAYNCGIPKTVIEAIDNAEILNELIKRKEEQMIEEMYIYQYVNTGQEFIHRLEKIGIKNYFNPPFDKPLNEIKIHINETDNEIDKKDPFYILNHNIKNILHQEFEDTIKLPNRSFQERIDLILPELKNIKKKYKIQIFLYYLISSIFELKIKSEIKDLSDNYNYTKLIDYSKQYNTVLSVLFNEERLQQIIKEHKISAWLVNQFLFYILYDQLKIYKNMILYKIYKAQKFNILNEFNQNFSDIYSIFIDSTFLEKNNLYEIIGSDTIENFIEMYEYYDDIRNNLSIFINEISFDDIIRTFKH